MRTMNSPPSAPAVTVMRPPQSVYLQAFVRRFPRSCSSLIGSPATNICLLGTKMVKSCSISLASRAHGVRNVPALHQSRKHESIRLDDRASNQITLRKAQRMLTLLFIYIEIIILYDHNLCEFRDC